MNTRRLLMLFLLLAVAGIIIKGFTGQFFAIAALPKYEYINLPQYSFAECRETGTQIETGKINKEGGIVECIYGVSETCNYNVNVNYEIKSVGLFKQYYGIYLTKCKGNDCIRQDVSWQLFSNSAIRDSNDKILFDGKQKVFNFKLNPGEKAYLQFAKLERTKTFNADLKDYKFDEAIEGINYNVNFKLKYLFLESGLTNQPFWGTNEKVWGCDASKFVAQKSINAPLISIIQKISDKIVTPTGVEIESSSCSYFGDCNVGEGTSWISGYVKIETDTLVTLSDNKKYFCEQGIPKGHLRNLGTIEAIDPNNKKVFYNYPTTSKKEVDCCPNQLSGGQRCVQKGNDFVWEKYIPTNIQCNVDVDCEGGGVNFRSLRDTNNLAKSCKFQCISNKCQPVECRIDECNSAIKCPDDKTCVDNICKSILPTPIIPPTPPQNEDNTNFYLIIVAIMIIIGITLFVPTKKGKGRK